MMNAFNPGYSTTLPYFPAPPNFDPIGLGRPRIPCFDHDGPVRPRRRRRHHHGQCQGPRPYYMQDRCVQPMRLGSLKNGVFTATPVLSGRQNDALDQLQGKEQKLAQAKARLQQAGFSQDLAIGLQMLLDQSRPANSTKWTRQNGNGQQVVMYLSPDGTLTPGPSNP